MKATDRFHHRIDTSHDGHHATWRNDHAARLKAMIPAIVFGAVVAVTLLIAGDG